ncbi:MAG: stage II sporulation protein P [Clostridiales bacterium]|nr:stage II sporulation protein P [Clostridiales bacterium]
MRRRKKRRDYKSGFGKRKLVFILTFIIFVYITYFLGRLFLSGTTGIFVENPGLVFNPSLLFSDKEEPSVNTTDLEALKKHYYIVDGKTGLDPALFNVEAFEKEDLKIKLKKNKPKVLVFHTHSHEAFADSREGVQEDTIVGVGEKLCEILEKDYGITCLHVTEQFDYADGSVSILGAYERMEPVIRQYLKENKTIEVVIDLHRDGVAEGTRLVTEVNGKTTAQIMFFNGICRMWNGGVLEKTDGLENPYVKTNLAFSYKMKQKADSLYPGFARKIYINAYRYSLHMKPLSSLVELGAQTNTVEEAFNACEPLARIIAETIT